MCEIATVLHGVFAPEVKADVRLVESDDRARLELATLLRRACRDPEANRHVRHRVYDNASVRRRRLRDATYARLQHVVAVHVAHLRGWLHPYLFQLLLFLLV